MQNNNIINTMEDSNLIDTSKSEQQVQLEQKYENLDLPQSNQAIDSIGDVLNPKNKVAELKDATVMPSFEEQLESQKRIGQHVPYYSNKAIVDNNLKHIYEAKDGGDTDYAYGLVINELRDRLKINNDLYDLDTLGELYFGKKVDIKEATEHFAHLYELQQQSEANKLKYSEERAIWEKETPERKAEILESNPDYENRIFADRYNDAMAYLNNLSTKDKKFVFEFINAEGTRNAIVEQYKDEFARIQVEDPDRYARLIGAIITLNPHVDSNWLFRGFERFWESLGDSSNAFNYSQEYEKFGVNEHRIYDYIKANGGMDAFFDAQGNYLDGKEEEINQEIKRLQDDEYNRLNEFAGYNGVTILENKKYTNKEIYELAKKGAEFRHEKATEQLIRDLKRTNYGKYSGVSEFLSKGVTTLLDSGLYVGGTATLTALTKNPYISGGLMWKLMYERSYAENIQDFTLNGGLTYDQAKTTAKVTSALDATFETIENYINIKIASPSDYLLKTIVKDIKANVVHKQGWSAIAKEYLKDTGGELLIAEYPQAFTTYLAKEYLIRNYGANYSSDENAKELGDRLWEATMLTPFVTGVYSQFGNYRISQEVQQATGKGLIRGLFDSDIRKGTPKDYYDNQAQATGAIMQAEKATSDMQNKYNPDFLEAYKEAKTEEEKQSVVNKEFPNEADRKAFYEDLKVVQKAETDAFVSYNRTIADAVNKHREQSQKLKEEAESTNVQSASELGIEQNGEDKFELVNNFLDKFGGREYVEIYDTVEDMPFNIKNEFKKGGDGAKGAFYIKDNKIYLIKDRLNDKYDALSTLVHERTHFVRNLLKTSNAFNDLMVETTKLMGGVEIMRLSLPEAYRNNRDDIIVEEYLARVCERVILEQELSKKDKGVWNSIKNFFKNWFFGEDETLSSRIDKRIAEIGKKIFDLANESIVENDKKQSEETGQKAKAKTQKEEKVEAKVEVPNKFKGLSKLVEDLDKTLPRNYKLSEDFKKALEVLNKANKKRMKLDEYLLTNGKNEKLSDFIMTLADYLEKSKKGSGLFDILKRYGKNAEAVVEASDYYPLFKHRPLTKQQLLELAKEKHIWGLEDAQKSVYEFIDSIPDEDATNKVEILEEYELESLRDRDLEYLATYGNKQADKELLKRLQSAEFERTPLLRRLLDEGIKLPTPKSMKNLGGDLYGEMQAIWDSMPFNLKMKFFRKQDSGSGDLDILALDLGFDSEADFITQIADEVREVVDKQIRLSSGDLQKVDFAENLEAQRQYDEVLAQWTNPDGTMKEGYMLAPNGKPTNLTERQWVMVRTQNFKNWFGDWENDPENASKVIDENGEPLVVYHGTKDKSFTVFDSERAGSKFGEVRGKLFYFSSEYTTADSYASGLFSRSSNGRVIPAFLNIRNLKDFKGKKGILIKDEGFDGFKDGFTYGVFNPNQIKSATDNVGTYDRANDDIRFSIKADARTQEEKDALNQKFRDLYEQYKNGDQDTYKQAVELLKAEAERKGYAVKVYHGTGADGFNVADATSKHENNGEGNQAHGAGLYMAVSRDTAKKYHLGAMMHRREEFSIKGKNPSEYEIPTGLYRVEFLDFIRDIAMHGKEYFESQEKMYKGFYNTAKKRAEKPYKNPRTADKYYIEMSEWRRDIKRYESFRNFLKENNIDFGDIKKAEGTLFNWFTNLNDDNTLDVDKPLTEQGESVRKAIFEYYKSRPDDYITPKDIDDLNAYQDGGRFYKDVVFQMRREGASNPKLEASKLLAKLGIKGLTYVGEQDGRCYISFEGGATVKLQDPFTFDDNGELIPLTERFDSSNPDMRFSIEEQIETPQFKAWFGNSKVVDENGKPLHVYHGTNSRNADYSIFDVFKGKYHFFTSNKDVANSMGSYVYDVFLRIENPLIIDANGNTFGAIKDHSGGIVKFKDLTATQKKKLCKAFDLTSDELEQSYKPESKIDLVQAGVIKRPEKSSDEWAMFAKTNGYDGVIFKNLRDGAGLGELQKTSDVYVVFDSVQIKDATGENSGDFSLENPSIMWKIDDNKESVLKSIDEWLGDEAKSLGKDAKILLKKKSEYKEELKDYVFNDEDEVDIYDLIVNQGKGRVKKLNIDRIDALNNITEFIDFFWGGKSKGARHLISRHYGSLATNGKLSAKEILSLAKVIRLGRKIKYTNEEGANGWRYELKIAEDRFLCVSVSENKNNKQKRKGLDGYKYVISMFSKKNESLIQPKSLVDKSTRLLELQNQASNNIQSENNSESQVKKSEGELQKVDTRFLIEQDPDKHPIAYASIQMAKYMLFGKGEGFLRNIPSRLIEKLLPSERYSPFQQEKAIDMANRIVEKIAKKRQDFSDELALNREIKITQNDLFWDDYIKRISNEFISSGEWLNRLITKARQNIAKDLENIKPLSDEELGFDTTNAIENAINEEPKRKPKTTKPEEDPEDDVETETLGETEEGHDNELTNVDMELTPMDIREIVERIHNRIKEIGKAKRWDDNVIRMAYRNTLVDQLRKSAEKLTYGKEREAIISKINELATKRYALIQIEDGDRAGQKIDNYTLRAEHIALRIFKRSVRDTKQELLDKFEKLLRHVKAPKTIERADKRKMDAVVEARAYKIKQIAYMSEEVIDNEVQEATNRINSTETSASDDYYVQLIGDVNYLEDLQRFGALRDKTRTEIADAVDWLENRLKEEVEAQEEKVEQLKAEAKLRRDIFLNSINENERNAEFDSKAKKMIRVLLNSSSTFKDLLLGLGRASTGKNYKAFKSLVDKMMDECYVATTKKENEVFQKQQAFLKKIAEIYKIDERDALKHILQTREDLQEFSVQAKPMSVSTLLQRLSMAEQSNYRYNTYIHCCKRSSEYDALETRLNELYDIEEKTDADRLEIQNLEAKLEAIEKTSVEEYAKKIRAKLSKKDLLLLDWFRDFYKEERPSLSDANEIITGLSIPQADELYTPMKMLREGGTNEKHQVVAIVPKSMTPRVPNSLDMDESYGIVDMWNNRIAENAHYKAFSQLNIEWRGIFAHADFHKAVKQKFGEDVLKQLLDHFNDIMSVRLVDNHKIELVDKVNGFFAITALGFNLGSGVRQLTGIPIFANFIGVKNTTKYLVTAWSDEGRQAMKEILESDTAQRRLGMGNNQAIVEALDNLDQNKFWSWYKRNSMIFNKIGDILPIMVIGQGVYRSKLEEYIKTMPLEEAKTRAMNEMWAIAEASQQSPSVMNMGVVNRRGGSLGKVLTLFTSSPQLMLSREVEAMNRFLAVRKKYKANPQDEAIRNDYSEARKNVLKTLFINHVLSQGGYLLATWLWKALLGDDWDEKDWWAMIFEVLAGPFGSLIVFGRFITALNSNYGKSDIAPISALGNAIGGFGSLVGDILTLNGEEILQDLDKIAKTLNAPYRDVRRIYKNATDKKEGDIW